MAPKVTVEHAKKVEEKIIQAARKQFAKKGYALTSMDEIAKSANVSKGGLYHHFPSKEELFVSLCGQNQQDLQQSFSGLFQKKENLMLDLGKFYDILYSSDRTLEQIWLTVMAEAQRNSKIKAIIIQQRQESEQWVTGFFMHMWQDIGLFKDYNDNDLKIIAKGMISLLQGTTLDRLTLKDPNATKKAWIKTMYAIFKGSR